MFEQVFAEVLGLRDKFNKSKENIASLATQIQALTMCVREGVCVRGTPLFPQNLSSFGGLVVKFDTNSPEAILYTQIEVHEYF